MKHNNFKIDDMKAIFFLPAKCANTSIKDAIFKTTGLRDVVKHSWFNKRRITPCMAYTYGSYKKYVVVRNPYERLVSCYRNKALDLQYSGWVSQGFRDGMFAEFVECVVKTPAKKQNIHSRPYWFDTYCKDERVPTEVLRVESLDDDWEVLRREYDLPELEVLNSSGDYDWKEYYTSELMGKVTAYYQRDILDYGY